MGAACFGGGLTARVSIDAMREPIVATRGGGLMLLAGLSCRREAHESGHQFGAIHPAQGQAGIYPMCTSSGSGRSIEWKAKHSGARQCLVVRAVHHGDFHHMARPALMLRC